MTTAEAAFIGIFPSLEVLPIFEDFGRDGLGFPFQPKAFSSYGEIARKLLTGKLCGGIIPWELFVADIWSLPGQRNQWNVPIFLQPCPPELVLRESVFKAFYPAKGAAKLPGHLTLALESQNSLTKRHFHEWLKHWPKSESIDIRYRMLPIELMIEALETGAIDAMIVPSPWGIHADAEGIGFLEPRFTPGPFVQKLAMVCHRDFMLNHKQAMNRIHGVTASARRQLASKPGFEAAVRRMTASGRPMIALDLMEKAATTHRFASFDKDSVPDAGSLAADLARLAEFSALPIQIAPLERTARLLVADDP
jgi:hypothetical protein